LLSVCTVLGGLKRNLIIKKDNLMKQKRLYERPAMQVVELRQEAPLVCTSGQAEDYQIEGSQDW
jgi:hypothetical protein